MSIGGFFSSNQLVFFDGLAWTDSSSNFVVQKARIQIWLFEQKDLRIEGRIIVSCSTDCLDLQNLVLAITSPCVWLYDSCVYHVEFEWKSS